MKRSAALVTGCIAAALLVVLGAFDGAEAKVSETEAARLGTELTPLGAIQGGSDDGTIPPWEGGITEPPAGYEPGMHHPDPFAGDQALFTITAGLILLRLIPMSLMKDMCTPEAIAWIHIQPYLRRIIRNTKNPSATTTTASIRIWGIAPSFRR